MTIAGAFMANKIDKKREVMDNKQSDGGFVVCAQAPNIRAERKALGVIEAPDSHNVYFNVCNSTLKKRRDYSEKNVMLRLALQKYKDTLVSEDAAGKAELKAAESKYTLCKADYKTNAKALYVCQNNLDDAMVKAIENIPIQASHRYESTIKPYIDKLSAAKAAMVDAKHMQTIFKDKLDIAEARYNAAKDRFDTNKRLADIRLEIESNLEVGDINVEQD